MDVIILFNLVFEISSKILTRNPLVEYDYSIQIVKD